jgi:hypothetical protein
VTSSSHIIGEGLETGKGKQDDDGQNQSHDHPKDINLRYPHMGTREFIEKDHGTPHDRIEEVLIHIENPLQPGGQGELWELKGGINAFSLIASHANAEEPLEGQIEAIGGEANLCRKVFLPTIPSDILSHLCAPRPLKEESDEKGNQKNYEQNTGIIHSTNSLS